MPWELVSAAVPAAILTEGALTADVSQTWICLAAHRQNGCGLWVSSRMQVHSRASMGSHSSFHVQHLASSQSHTRCPQVWDKVRSCSSTPAVEESQHVTEAVRNAPTKPWTCATYLRPSNLGRTRDQCAQKGPSLPCLHLMCQALGHTCPLGYKPLK